MRRRIQISNSDSDGDLINLTPLLDVLFLILVFFILIAPLLDIDRIDLAPSSENREDLKESSQIKIYVQKNNSIWLGTHPITLSDLSIALDQFYKNHPNEIPQLYQDQDSNFGTYQKLKNLVESIGFEQLDVVLKTE